MSSTNTGYATSMTNTSASSSSTSATTTSTTQTSTTTPVYAVISSVSLESSDGEDDLANAVAAYLADLFAVPLSWVVVTATLDDSVIRSTKWVFKFVIAAPIEQANQAFEVIEQIANDTTANNFEANLNTFFESQGLEVNEESLAVTAPELKIVTATVTTVSVSETSATATVSTVSVTETSMTVTITQTTATVTSTITVTTATMTSTTTWTTATMSSTTTVTTATMTTATESTTATLTTGTTMSSIATLTTATETATATKTTFSGTSTTPTTQTVRFAVVWSVSGSMSFSSDGKEEQLESAVAIALAAYFDVPLSMATVTATIDRRLMPGRELTISQLWTVVHRIIADEVTIGRVYDHAIELSDASNVTALGYFDELLMTALSNEGVDNSEPVQVIHAAPQREMITASTTATEESVLPTATAEEGDAAPTMTEQDREAAEVIVGITVSVGIFLGALAALLVRYCRRHRSPQRAQGEERQDVVMSADDPEPVGAPSPSPACSELGSDDASELSI
ncbi:unnamed protein product [Prorocentrum cordatum]|uniref:Uncharacterized protein n=1 Tax=Prorocentrum cordatum TaxID=2364126 RepID=A0ABN9XR97_9DINO|nr:unnamed protein product [Polarella glacialis]